MTITQRNSREADVPVQAVFQPVVLGVLEDAGWTDDVALVVL